MISRSIKNKKTQGFTIIELMVSIAMLLIVSLGAAGIYFNQFRQEEENTIEYKLRYIRDSWTAMTLENINMSYPAIAGTYFWCLDLQGNGIANTANFALATGFQNFAYSDPCSAPPLCYPNSVVVELSNIGTGPKASTMMLYVDYLGDDWKIKRSFQQEITFSTNNASTMPIGSMLGPADTNVFGMSITKQKEAGCPPSGNGCVPAPNGIGTICW